jgi:hypothetical protein
MMALETEGGAAASETPQFTPITAPKDAPEQMTTTQAARMLAQLRHNPPKEQPAESAPDPRIKSGEAAPATESEAAPAAEDAAPVEAQPSGEAEAAPEPEAELSPIEPPRSWSKDEKERFKALPRETQEYLAERETERDREIRRTQNEAADKLKGLTAKEQAAEQARLQYEAALPQLLQSLQSQQAGEFADIRTLADVERLAREDWPRYLQWDVAQKKLAAVQQEMLSAQQRQAHEAQQKFSDFARKEDDLFTEKVPDMADPEKAAKLKSAALAHLKELGFEEAELASTWNGQGGISLRDHRMQLLIRDATLWREAQSKAKAATTKPVPPVQRPGVAQSRNTGVAAEIANLSKQLETASGMNQAKIAAKIVALRRTAAR